MPGLTLALLFADRRNDAGGGNHRHADGGKRCWPAVEQDPPPHGGKQQIDEIKRGQPAAVGCLIGTAEKNIAKQVEDRHQGQKTGHRQGQDRPADKDKGNRLLPGRGHRQNLEKHGTDDATCDEHKRNDAGQRQRAFVAAIAAQHENIAGIEESGQHRHHLESAEACAKRLKDKQAATGTKTKRANPPGTNPFTKHRSGKKSDEQRIGIKTRRHLRDGDLLRRAEKTQHT